MVIADFPPVREDRSSRGHQATPVAIVYLARFDDVNLVTCLPLNGSPHYELFPLFIAYSSILPMRKLDAPEKLPGGLKAGKGREAHQFSHCWRQPLRLGIADGRLGRQIHDWLTEWQSLAELTRFKSHACL